MRWIPFVRKVPNSLAALSSTIYLFSFWCKWRLVDIFLPNLSASPLFSSSSLSWPRNTWIFSVRGNVGICGRHGKNKQTHRSVQQQRSSASCLEVGWWGANTVFLPGPASLKIFVRYFFLSPSKIYFRFTSNTTGKIIPLSTEETEPVFPQKTLHTSLKMDLTVFKNLTNLSDF